jgi:hypothetical protein
VFQRTLDCLRSSGSRLSSSLRCAYHCHSTSFYAQPHKARPDLSIQDITALLVSLTNLSVSCYPDRLEYVDQILGFAAEKIKEYSEK